MLPLLCLTVIWHTGAMEKQKVMVVYGTRPEAIKVAPLILALQEQPEFEVVPVVTGQHREMLDQVNAAFGIEPAYDLDIMQHGASLSQVFARALESLDGLIEKEQPNVVVSQGDTTTATAAGLAAFHRQVPAVHLEAGLRSGDITSPFPEEANRVMLSRIASLHLAPTSVSRDNLLHEGIRSADIQVTGNTVIDALQSVVAKYDRVQDQELQERLGDAQRVLLVTAHRRENWGAPMEQIAQAVAQLATEHPELLVVVPMHKNPLVREKLRPVLEPLENVVLTEPLDYTDFAVVLERSDVVLTDSGGVQEEAPSLGKPVLVMRENTERPEAVTAGTVKLIGTDRERIVAEVNTLLEDEQAYDEMAQAVNPYGDGLAGARAAAAIKQLLGVGERMEDFAG